MDSLAAVQTIGQCAHRFVGSYTLDGPILGASVGRFLTSEISVIAVGSATHFINLRRAVLEVTASVHSVPAVVFHHARGYITSHDD